MLSIAEFKMQTVKFILLHLMMLGKLSDDISEDGTSVSSAPRHFKSKLEEALTAKQEFEAKVSTLDEKVKQYEAEIADLRLRVRICLL